MSNAIYFPAAVKRSLKSVRNAFKDPYPRSETLFVDEIVLARNNVEFRYRAKGDPYLITLSLTDQLIIELVSLEEWIRAQVLTAIAISFCPFFFKLTDFASVDVATAPLDEETILFFERFLVGGLGEFRYLQGLDPTRPIRVTARGTSTLEPIQFEARDNLLMLNGGGKDTIVAAELLKASKQPFSWVSIRSNETRRRVVELSGVHQSIEVGYQLDPAIGARKRYPWGHFPNTSIVLSIGLLIALLTKSKYVAAGNEFSANFGNLSYRGHEVNHQYTKSLEFEKLFSSFVKRRVTKSVDVFSILRPFDDLQLAQLFSGQSGYFGDFISCNRGIGRGRGEWCKECAKCAFTALALYPFVSAESIQLIFGEDIITRPIIRRQILQLVGGKIKPWECVGTRDECVLALALLLDRKPVLEFDEYPRRKDLVKAISGWDHHSLRVEILDNTREQHLVPEPLVDSLNRGLRLLSNGRLRIKSPQSA